jgi:hypothetical protein
MLFRMSLRQLAQVCRRVGTGLQAGIATVQQERQAGGQPALENGLDVFHTTQEARRVLRQLWSELEGLWEQAEAASRRVERATVAFTRPRRQRR